MSEPFLAEVKMFGFDFAPRGWAFCDGQILPIAQNQALFSLLGAAYGGDGRVTFALPDLRGRTPLHVSQNHLLGQRGGESAHTLDAAEMPTHNHATQGSAANADSLVPTDNLPAAANNLYNTAANLTPLAASSISNVGEGQPHDNMQPYLGINFAIAMQGLYPSRN